MLCEYSDAALISLHTCAMILKGFRFSLSLVWPHADITLTSLVSLFNSEVILRDRNQIRSHGAQSRHAGSIISGARLLMHAADFTWPPALTAHELSCQSARVPSNQFMNFLTNQVPFEIFKRCSVQQTDAAAEIKDSRSFGVRVSGNVHSAGEQSTYRIYNKPVRFSNYHRFGPHTCTVFAMRKTVTFS